MTKTMSANTLNSCTICFIVIQFVLIHGVSSESRTSYENSTVITQQSQSDRQKRDLHERMPTNLDFKIFYPNGKNIHLNWEKQPINLANQHLPIIKNNVNIGPQIMAMIGQFVFYYDLKKCSAVVYFEKTNSFFGSIGLEYTIENLPYQFNDEGRYRGMVNEAYITKHSNTPRDDHVCPPAPQPIVADPEDDQGQSKIIDSVLELEDDLNNRYHPPPLSIDSSDSESTGSALSLALNPSLLDDFDLSAIPDLETEEDLRLLFPVGTEDDDILSMMEPGPSTKRRRLERDLDEPSLDGMMDANNTKVINKRIRRKRPKRNVYYLETLVIISRDITDMCQKRYEGERYISNLVKHYIIYFNNIAMMYAKLRKTVRLMINIAKIVIEHETTDLIRNNALHFAESVANRRNYLRSNQKLFPMDSFDYVVVLTSSPIKDTSNILAKRNSLPDLYHARKENLWYDKVPMTILRMRADFQFAANEIGRVLGMTFNSKAIESQIVTQSQNIMQRKSSKCLEWSSQNTKNFYNFFKHNRNRCFLLNKPRSLKHPGPHKLITPWAQCECFGYNTYKHPDTQTPYNIPASNCEKPLQCEIDDNGRVRNVDTLLPLDGTVCHSQAKKVCWNMKCVDIFGRIINLN